MQVDPAKIGQLVAQYSYDGLGRLIRTQRPESAAGATLHVTDLYYDGVRVVQEAGWTGVIPEEVAVASASGGQPTTMRLARRAEWFVSDSALLNRWPARRLEREYVWGMDAAAYVDECLTQLVFVDAHSENAAGEEIGDDRSPVVLHCLNDQSASLVGLTDQAGNLVAQYSYLPYGQTRSVEYFMPYTPPDPEPYDGPPTSLTSSKAIQAAQSNRIGHQGLRFERLDEPFGQPLAARTSGFIGVYLARNRLYRPDLGRFISNDPNGLGGPALGAPAHSGGLLASSDGSPDLAEHFASGMNTHIAFGNNPLIRRDPLGLSDDPFDIADDFVAEQSASTAAFMAQLRGGFDTAGHIAFQLAQLYPPIGLAVSMYNVANSLAHGETPSLWDVVGMLPVVGKAAKGVALLGKASGYFSEANAIYAAGLAGGRASNAVAAAGRTIGATGRYGEEFLATLGGVSKYFRTPLGARLVDRFVNGVAHESKVGRVAYSSEIAVQVAKDRALLEANSDVAGIVWHFFRSPVTKEIGPTQPLRDALKRAGITVIEHINLE